MKKILFLFISLIFVSYPAFAKFPHAMTEAIKSWFGENINAAINQLGYPSEEKTIAGRHIYIWKSKRIRVYNSFNGTAYDTFCDKYLEVDANNIIISGTWKGNCPATYNNVKKFVNPEKNYWKTKKEQKEVFKIEKKVRAKESQEKI